MKTLFMATISFPLSFFYFSSSSESRIALGFLRVFISALKTTPNVPLPIILFGLKFLILI